MAKAFFVDLTRCTGCRGCQIACKQWKNLPAEETANRGGHTNPPDLSSVTYKTVHMREVGKGKDFRMLFFPEQCRHCELAPCMTASTIDGAIVQDENTGAVLFTPLTAQLDGQAVGVPSRLAVHQIALLRLVAADDVLDRARHDVMDARQSVGRGRPLVKDECRMPLARRNALVEGVFRIPLCQHVGRQLRQIESFVLLELHISKDFTNQRFSRQI